MIVYACSYPQVISRVPPISGARKERVKHLFVFTHSPATYAFRNRPRPWSYRAFFRATIRLKDRRHIDGPLGPLKFPGTFGLSALRLFRNIVYGSPDIS